LREYAFTVDDRTHAALRLLARPWIHCSVSPSQAEMRLAGGIVVRIAAEARDVEPGFECFRLSAFVSGTHALHGADAAFAGGAVGVTVLRGEDWLVAGVPGDAEPPLDEPPALGVLGPPGSRPWNAETVCAADDGLLLESAAGGRLLVYCTWPPYTLAITREPGHIDAFCAARERVVVIAPDAPP
jgi:hypothetical protein